MTMLWTHLTRERAERLGVGRKEGGWEKRGRIGKGTCRFMIGLDIYTCNIYIHMHAIIIIR